MQHTIFLHRLITKTASLTLMGFKDEMLRLENYYFYLESSFIETIRIIPFENRSKTFSPRLYEILQGTCSQIESILKSLCKELGLTPEKGDASGCYKTLNSNGAISCQDVIFKTRPDWQPIRPFVCRFACNYRSESNLHQHSGTSETTMPTWWSQYNRTKHDLPKGYVAGSIENTYLALAGLYVLHFMTSQLERGRESFLTQDCWVSFMPIEIDRYDPEAEIRKGVRPKSDVFVPLRECMLHRRSR